MSDHKPSAKSIFLSAVEIDSESRRATFVQGKCGGDPDLQQEVQRLLKHQAASSFLEKPAVATARLRLDCLARF